MANYRLLSIEVCFIIYGASVSGAEVNCTTTNCPCPAFNAWANLQYYPLIGANASSFVHCGYYVDNNDADYTSYEVFSCPEGFSFVPRKTKDDSTPLCQPSTQSGSFFDCKGKANRSVPISDDPILYYTCDSSQNVTALNSCPFGMYFNENDQKCDMRCTGIGTYPYSLTIDDSSPQICNFYTCTYDFLYLRFNLVTQRCASGTYFDRTMLICVTGISTDCAS